MLPRVRSFCAANDDIFHYEVESVEQIGEALRTIARVRPSILVINGGDGTVQATLHGHSRARTSADHALKCMPAPSLGERFGASRSCAEH